MASAGSRSRRQAATSPAVAACSVQGACAAQPMGKDRQTPCSDTLCQASRAGHAGRACTRRVMHGDVTAGQSVARCAARFAPACVSVTRRVRACVAHAKFPQILVNLRRGGSAQNSSDFLRTLRDARSRMSMRASKNVTSNFRYFPFSRRTHNSRSRYHSSVAAGHA